MRISKSNIYLNEERIPYLKTEFVKNYTKEKQLDSPKKIAQCVKDIWKLDILPEEYAYVIALNAKCKPVTFFEVSHGSDTEAVMSPKNILTRVLLTGCPNIVLIHSHPSGDTNPSQADVKLTKRIKEACDIIGIKLLDHIIVGDNYYSFMEHNVL